MAIEIIPKERKRSAFESKPFNILYFLSLSLLVLSIGSYIAMFFFLKSYSKKLEEVKNSISQAESKEVKELESGLLEAKDKIDVFADVFASYQKTSGLFGFLKESCHEKVFFYDTDISPDSLKVEISGRAETFKILGEQILIFKEKKEIVRDLLLSSISIAQEGGINFKLTLNLYPKVFE